MMPKNRFLRFLVYCFSFVLGYAILWTAFNFFGTREISDSEAAIPNAAKILGLDGPYLANGDIDFLKLHNQHGQKSVPIEKNAIVVLLENLDKFHTKDIPTSFYDELNIEKPTPPPAGYISLFDWKGFNSKRVRGGNNKEVSRDKKWEFTSGNP